VPVRFVAEDRAGQLGEDVQQVGDNAG